MHSVQVASPGDVFTRESDFSQFPSISFTSTPHQSCVCQWGFVLMHLLCSYWPVFFGIKGRWWKFHVKVQHWVETDCRRIGKSTGGGTAVLVSNSWRNPGHVAVKGSRTPDMELLVEIFCPSCPVWLRHLLPRCILKQRNHKMLLKWFLEIWTMPSSPVQMQIIELVLILNNFNFNSLVFLWRIKTYYFRQFIIFCWIFNWFDQGQMCTTL